MYWMINATAAKHGSDVFYIHEPLPKSAYHRIGVAHEPRKVAIWHKRRRAWRNRERFPVGKAAAYILRRAGQRLFR
jgi:hypothetical protein